MYNLSEKILVTSFLKDSKRVVENGETLSLWQDLEPVGPHGSSLGLLLFLINFYDLPKSILSLNTDMDETV